jgi:general secretion pathway protein L
MTPQAVLLPPHAELQTTPVAQWRWAHDYRAGDSTVVVVPVQALSWHRVPLPAGGLRPAARLRAVLEGLLEDQVLDDPALLHFALAPDAKAGQSVWVAACARSWLQDALQALERHGHTVRAMVPEFAPAPGAAQQLTLLTQTDSAWAVWCDEWGVHQRPLHAEGVAETPLSTQLPPSVRGLPVLAEPALADLAAALHLGPLTLQPAAQRLALCATSPWGLAQGELAPRNHWVRRLQQGAFTLWQTAQWRPARWAAIALVGVQLLGLNVAAWQARSQLAAQRAALGSTLMETFPSTPFVVDAPLQMERAVGALRTAQGSLSPRDLENQLAALASTNTFQTLATTDTAPSTIEFVAGSLRVQGLGLGAEALQSLQSELRAHGYSATQLADTLQLDPVRTP